ncbi:MAG TPA: cytochrome c maturation protein CcmE [Coxiellaceae bacterium]|nr:cytochrome c maturation protein CcmE [Coxiellaceae bacterium]
MQTKRKKRLGLIVSIVLGVGVATGLVLYSLKQNINLYYTPQQLLSVSLKPHQVVRLGGLVKKGSVKRESNNLTVRFVLTDYHAKVAVEYTGVLPALFREGQGIVAEGEWLPNGLFKAREVLAKHDENYHPPGVEK